MKQSRAVDKGRSMEWKEDSNTHLIQVPNRTEAGRDSEKASE